MQRRHRAESGSTPGRIGADSEPTENVLGRLPDLPVAIGETALQSFVCSRVVERRQRDDCAALRIGGLSASASSTLSIDDGSPMAPERRHGRLATERVGVSSRHSAQRVDAPRAEHGRRAFGVSSPSAHAAASATSGSLSDRAVATSDVDDPLRARRPLTCLTPGELAGTAPHPSVRIVQGSDDHVRGRGAPDLSSAPRRPTRTDGSTWRDSSRAPAASPVCPATSARRRSDAIAGG